MAINKRLLVKPPSTGITPSEHFGVVLYEGDSSSSHSINGGKFGAAANFNGSSSTIVIPNAIEQPLKDAKEFGVSMWFNLASLPTGSDEDFLISLYQEGYLDIRIKANGVIQGKVAENSSGTDRIVTSANSVIAANTWYHVVWTGKTNDLKLYINGSSVATGNTWNGTFYHSNAGCRIGSKSGPSYYFNGKIDQTRIFQKQLSSSEVTTLYTETVDTVESLTPLGNETTDTLQVLGDSSCIALYKFENNEDDESTNYDLTGNEIQYAAGRYGQAASFNGSSSYAQITSSAPQDNSGVMSVSFWAKTTSTSRACFFIAEGPSTAREFFKLENYGWQGTNSLRVSYNNVMLSNIDNQAISDGNWHHFVITAGNGYVKTYKDNSLLASQSVTINDETLDHFVIGYRKYNNDIYYNGEIDQFRIFNKELSASEVTTLYNENPLIASYRFEGNANDDMRTYDGTATNVTYEYGLGFKPDLVWIKDRENAEQHILNDSTRGATKDLSSNTTAAEATRTTGFLSFDDGGFTLGTDGGGVVNDSSRGPYVAWCWKANGGTTSSNTDGSITTTVQANTAAGFSIITYTGDGASTSTIGHGLDSAPELVLLKTRSHTSDWPVYSLGTTSASYRLVLNSFAAQSTTNNPWNSTAPTSTVINLGSSGNVNINSRTFVAYAFHSVDGFSKIGSYMGNSSNDGPIVETGFEPAFLMIKCSSDAGSWFMYDNKRNTSNPRKNYVLANASNVEASDMGGVDFLSNGFQIKEDHDDVNDTGDTYIYMAFAADPDTEAPTVAKSFSTVTYTGNGGTQTISGLGYKPGLIWMKRRDTAQEHALVNIVSGTNKHLYSDLTSAEQTTTNGVSSFNDDGWTMGANGLMNNTNNTYVGWAWKADDNEPTIFGGAAKAVYKFEDNGNDVTGNNNATATSITYGTGKFNKGAIFNGTTSNFKTGSSFTGTNGGSFTLSCWVKIDDITGVENLLLGRFSYTTSDKQFILRVLNGGAVRINVYNSSGTGESITTTDTLSIDTWYHIVAVVDGTKKSLYIDGELSVSETGSVSSNSSATGFLEIGGAGHLPASDAGRLDGMMDQVRIYNGAVSDIGVAALYAETASDNDDTLLGGPPETITSANANAGFSIVKYEGDGQANHKIQHGLSSAPEFVIIKNLNDTEDWQVFGNTLFDRMQLNNNGTDDGNFPLSYSATTITLPQGGQEANNAWNASGDEYIAYCFHSVSNYSKISSYTGNGGTLNVTGLGFQPDWVLIKETDGVDSWQVYDSVRGAGKVLYPNGSNAEYAGSELSSFDSDGFTVTGNPNENGKTYIYMAFKIN